MASSPHCAQARRAESLVLARTELQGPHPLSQDLPEAPSTSPYGRPALQHHSCPAPFVLPSAHTQSLGTQAQSIPAQQRSHQAPQASGSLPQQRQDSASSSASGALSHDALLRHSASAANISKGVAPGKGAPAEAAQGSGWGWGRRKARETPLLAAPISGAGCAEDMHLSITIGECPLPTAALRDIGQHVSLDVCVSCISASDGNMAVAMQAARPCCHAHYDDARIEVHLLSCLT